VQGAPQAAPRACSLAPTRLPSSRSCARACAVGPRHHRLPRSALAPQAHLHPGRSTSSPRLPSTALIAPALVAACTPPTRQPQSDRSYPRPRDDQQFQHCCARSRSPVLQPAAATRPPVPSPNARPRQPHVAPCTSVVELCSCAAALPSRRADEQTAHHALPRLLHSMDQQHAPASAVALAPAHWPATPRRASPCRRAATTRSRST
jgi:hypothetical protein